MKNNKGLIIIMGSAIAILLAIIPIYYLVKARIRVNSGTDYIHLGENEALSDVGNNYIFTNYDDFKSKTGSDLLTEQDFKKNNYVLVTLIWDGCLEDDIKVEGYELKDNKLHFNFTYYAGCGPCAPIYDYYLVPIVKNITSIEVELDGDARNNPDCDPMVSYKPMIYLYPEEKIDVSIKLGYPDLITTTYPKYNESWNVTANPDGSLKDSDNKTYYGLYWEGLNNIKTNFDDGFVVKKDELIPFFEEKLTILGLTERESNEFIIYWLPILEKNEYNLIRFESLEEINKQMPLYVKPNPDTIIRVLMEYKPIDEKIEIKEQTLTTPTREGFTLVEWGGTLIK